MSMVFSWKCGKC